MATKQWMVEKLTASVIEAMENGIPPWNCPWVRSLPMNSKGKAYRGSNVWFLSAIQAGRKYSSPQWFTFKQLVAAGGSIKGKKDIGVPVVYFQWIYKKDDDGNVIKRFPITKYYTVFNTDEIDGIDGPDLTAAGAGTVEEFDEFLIRARDGGRIAPWENTGGNRAFYRPGSDEIRMPLKEKFHTTGGYYSTLFHEAVHSTGHSSRLARLKSSFKGDEKYSFEELVAEMGAGLLNLMLGNEYDDGEESATYLANWLQVLKGNLDWLLKAGGLAQKAVDYMAFAEYKGNDSDTGEE